MKKSVKCGFSDINHVGKVNCNILAAKFIAIARSNCKGGLHFSLSLLFIGLAQEVGTTYSGVAVMYDSKKAKANLHKSVFYHDSSLSVFHQLSDC